MGAYLKHSRSPIGFGGVCGCLIGFFSIGALQAVYGPLSSSVAERFSVSSELAGMTLSSHFFGALLGVICTYLLEIRNFTLKGLCVASAFVMFAGVFCSLVSTNWIFFLVCLFIAGLGFGGVDYGMNKLFSVRYSEREAVRMLNLLNGMFGLGSIVAPILVRFTYDSLPESLFFISIAIFISFALSFCIRSSVNEQSSGVEYASFESVNFGSLVKYIILFSFILIYVLHVAIETGIGGWESLHLQNLGYSPSASYWAVSAFWACMTLGRFSVSTLSSLISAKNIVLMCCVGLTVSLLLVSFGVVSIVGYAAAGIFIGPLFPTCIPWMQRLIPEVSSGVAVIVATSMIGGILVPFALGKFIGLWGVAVVPWSIACISFIMVLATLILFKFNNRVDGKVSVK